MLRGGMPILSKKQPKIICRARVEVDAYIPGLKSHWFYTLSYKSNILLETLISLLFSHVVKGQIFHSRPSNSSHLTMCFFILFWQYVFHDWFRDLEIWELSDFCRCSGSYQQRGADVRLYDSGSPWENYRNWNCAFLEPKQTKAMEKRGNFGKCAESESDKDWLRYGFYSPACGAGWGSLSHGI